MDSSVKNMIRHLRRVLSRRGVSPHDADDLIQDAYQRLEIYRQENEVSKPEGFLVRTAINLSIDRVRRRKRSGIVAGPIEDFVIVDKSPRPDEVYATRRRLERLNDGFAALDPLTRQMLRAQRVEGMSVASIADRHNLSVSAVEKRLAKGILFLMNWMDGW
ncbi:sigma-70 family RNA polymerase sigma factor [Asticcacaulis sp. SL142]|uniref:RNA polymerase sigma factor n=1 Tax=Asticcacaulis sp. SL142 TaxID=2995155 RepID=UPI00226CBC4C|nr:sigma-70 family RNA polymerase sigma factor [Asticcacaulis sp. SL142]WAC49195.1 sigma-70 family RNA polymerase sigma factor [Asticcacaulis sp. SL142]